MSADHRALARAALVELGRETRAERWIVARGRSMLPTIRPGDRLLVAIGRRPERIGQVVIVEHDGHQVAHRVVAARAAEPDPRWVTKGDAEAYADAPFDPAAVTGIVVGRERPTGSFRRRGFDGRAARWIARVSWFDGRVAWRARGVSRRLPHPLRAPILRLLVFLTRVPTRLISALVPWLDQEIRAEGR